MGLLRRILIGRRVAKRTSRSNIGDLGALAVILLLGFMVLLPFVYAVMQSLKPMEEIFVFPPRFFVVSPTLRNYSELFMVANNSWVPFLRYVFNSVFVSVTVTAGVVMISSLAAFVLSKGTLPGRKILFNIIVFTLLFSYEVTSIPQYVILSRMGLINNYGALIFPALAMPLGVFLMKQFLDQMLPDAVIESAKIDGAGIGRVFLSIAMPNVRPAWITLVIFSFQAVWNREGLEYVYSEPLKMLPTMFRQIASVGIARAGAGAAAAVVLMLPPILIFIFSQNKIVQTMAHSGIK